MLHRAIRTVARRSNRILVGSSNWNCVRFHASSAAPTPVSNNSFQAQTSQPHSSPETSSPSSSFSSSSPPIEEDIDFGSRRVPRSAKQALVHDVFARVASSYDLMNDAMSFGVHRVWKWQLVQSLAPAANVKHLDVAGGTGDIAFRVLEAAQQVGLPTAYRVKRQTDLTTNAGTPEEQAARYESSPQVIVCDINENMLRVGIDRARSQGIDVGELVSSGIDPLAPLPEGTTVQQYKPSELYQSHGPLAFVTGNAECLPFPDNSFDSYTIVFGLRNVTDRMKALRDARRVLKPGGRFMCMELSKVTIPGFDKIYDEYSRHIIPELGQLLVNDRASYAYLIESIRQFPNQETLKSMMIEAGFQAVSYTNMTGGIVALHEGFKHD